MTEHKVLKVTVTLERREDGGLYAYSDDLPGFVLSHIDAHAVVADIEPALSTLLSHKFGCEITVKPMVGLREALIKDGIIDETPRSRTMRDYAAIAA